MLNFYENMCGVSIKLSWLELWWMNNESHFQSVPVHRKVWFQWWLMTDIVDNNGIDEKDIDVDVDKSEKDEDAAGHDDKDAVGKIKIKWS